MPSFNLETAAKRRDQEGLSLEEREVNLAEELYDTYQSAQETWSVEFQEDLEFVNGVQWTKNQVDVIEARDQDPIVVNVVKPAVRHAISMMTANNPSFRTTAKEDSDRRVGKLFSDILAHIWYVSDGNTRLKQSLRDYYIGGRGVLYAYADPNADHGKGEVFVKDLDPLEVYPDPNSTDPYWRDAAHILLSRTMTREQLEATWPDKKEVIEEANTTERDSHPTTDNYATHDQQFKGDISEGYHEHYRIIERYSKVQKQFIHYFFETEGEEEIVPARERESFEAQEVILIEGAESDEVVTDESRIADLRQIIEDEGNIFHEELVVGPQGQQTTRVVPGPATGGQNVVPNSERRISVVTIGDLVREGLVVANPIQEERIQAVTTVGEKLLQRQILPISEYPIVPVQNGFNRNPYPMSDVRDVRDLQKYLNKVTTLTVAHAASSANVKAFVPRGSVDKSEVEQEWERPGAAIIEYNPEVGQPVIASPVQLPAELYQQADRAERRIQRIMGVFDMQRGDPSDAPRTFKGTIAIDEFGKRRIQSKLDDVEGALKTLGEVCITLAQNVYTEEKVVRLFQPNHDIRESTFNTPLYDEYSGELIGRVNDITVGDYDVQVVTGSTLPSNRWAQLEAYMEFYDRGIIDQIEVLKKSEIFDVKGVLERSGQMQQMAETIQKLQEQVKDLKGDLQTATRAELNAEKRAEVQKFKSRLKETEVNVDKAAELFESRLSDNLDSVRRAAEDEQRRQTETQQ